MRERTVESALRGGIRLAQRRIGVERVDDSVLSEPRPVDPERGAELEVELRLDVLGVAGPSEHADHLAPTDALPDVYPDAVEMYQHRCISRTRRLVAFDDDRQSVAIRLPRLPLACRIDHDAVERRQDGLVLRRVDVDAVMESHELAISAGLGV